tara:strand:+ start:4945 stop:5151 length:207 start_codon:yes stop_codon:yes gene_type:complete
MPKRELSKGMLLILELQEAMDKLEWHNRVEYEVVTHHDVPNKEDGYIVIRKTNPDTWWINNEGKNADD